MSDLFTDEELDDIETKLNRALSDAADAYKHQINTLTLQCAATDARISELEAALEGIGLYG